MVRTLKRLYFALMAGCGVDAWLLRRVRRRDLVVVLNLHRVSPHPNPFFSPLHPRLFDYLLTRLRRHFRISTFRDLDRDRTRPAAVLSFDDGYHDFLEYALPLLDRHGLPANINVVPAYLNGELGWDLRLNDFLNGAPRTLIDEIRLPGFRGRLASDDFEAKVQYGLALKAFLKGQGRDGRLALWHHLESVMARADWLEPTRMMSCGDVREVARSCEVGAHSFSHEMMGLESDAFFQEDLGRCRAFFGQELGLPVEVYAFPHGSYRPEQVEALLRGGVRHVLVNQDRYANRQGSLYPRFCFHADSTREVDLRAVGYRPGRLLSAAAALGRPLGGRLAAALRGRGEGRHRTRPGGAACHP
jgi:peptidoglycan/xylan/chitin deacetylase (PgdA/CDA1 family)